MTNDGLPTDLSAEVRTSLHWWRNFDRIYRIDRIGIEKDKHSLLIFLIQQILLILSKKLSDMNLTHFKQ